METLHRVGLPMFGSWNGLFGLWIPVVLFGAWFLVTFYLMRAAVLRTTRNPGHAVESLDAVATAG